MSSKRNLNLKDMSDFHYLLELLLPLHNDPEFAWLPELFSTIGAEGLINLSRYAGGERIRIPTIDELSDAISSLEWYYKVWISKDAELSEIPVEFHATVKKIAKRFDDVRSAEADDC